MDNGQRDKANLGDNLNVEEWQKALEISAPAGMPTPEQILPKTETVEEPTKTPIDATTDTPTEPTTPDIPTEPMLGQITPVAMPNSSNDMVKPYNPTNIKTTGDYLDKGSLAEIEKLEDKLNQDGDLNAFYDHTRDLTEVNLDNSFSRKLYQDGGEQ